jgi:3',5'-cyclic AMP phosphodiesterase CpdA
MLLLAHVSDTHLDGGERAAARAARVIGYLRDLPRPVDAVVVTGDIADHGLPAEYEEARALLAAPFPVLTCPGNHDVRAAYRKVLLGEADGEAPGAPVNQVRRAGGALFALCDSTIPGRNEGLLDDATIAWLQGVLDQAPAGTPVFVCCHHPPVVLHSPFVDDIRLRGERRLAALVAGNPDVVALLCGHAHTPAATTFAGKPLLVAPGVTSTLRLPWEHGDVADWRDAVDLDLPPAIAFHVLGDDRRLTTHYRLIP